MAADQEEELAEAALCGAHVAYSQRRRGDNDERIRQMLFRSDPDIALTVDGSGLNIAHLACRAGLPARTIQFLRTQKAAQPLFCQLSPRHLDPLAYALVGPRYVHPSLVAALVKGVGEEPLRGFRHSSSGRSYLHLLLHHQLALLGEPDDEHEDDGEGRGLTRR